MTLHDEMRLSVVIPAHNEEGVIASTVSSATAALREADISYEIVVVDDRSTDRTADIVRELMVDDANIALVDTGPAGGGFGYAIRAGLEAFTGDAVAIMMADESDSPHDLVRYHRLLEQGYDCAFGSRFLPGSMVYDYPATKLIINRLANVGIRMLFRHGYNDTTNAFKAYRREVIDAVHPLLSNHFNITVELPLKAVVRGFTFGVVPISWTNRTVGESKLKLQEMGSRYAFIVLYVLLEHRLSRGDYRRANYRGLTPGQMMRSLTDRRVPLPDVVTDTPHPSQESS